MATILSDLSIARTQMRCQFEGAEEQFSSTVKVPAGTVIALNDILNLGVLGAGQQVTEIRVFTDDLDDGTTIVWDIGYQQLAPGTGYAGTNGSGVAIDYGVDTGITAASPATDTNYFVSGATFGRAAGWSTLTLNTDDTGNPVGLVGPVRVIATETAATPVQTNASLVDRLIRFQFKIVRDRRNPGIYADRGGFS